MSDLDFIKERGWCVSRWYGDPWYTYSNYGDRLFTVREAAEIEREKDREEEERERNQRVKGKEV